jgi:hypothetical protein
MEKDNSYLIELLTKNIRELEKVEDDSHTINFVARRIGNIVKHMKDLRDDLRPRGHANGGTAAVQAGESTKRINTMS